MTMIQALLKPIITSTTAISFLNELGHYLQALPVGYFAVLGSGSASEINISDFAKSLTYLQKSLIEYVEANKKQNTLDSWLQPSRTSSS